MIRVLDLFCGGGGSSYGARAAGAEIVAGVDASQFATAVFAANFPGARAVTLRMDEETKPADIGNVGRIDLLLASPECTHHTCARGARLREESSKATARYVLNFATALQPRWVVLENVLHMRSWDGYAPLLAALHRLGYNPKVQILDSSHFGVPQARRRLFIIGDNQATPPRIVGLPGRPSGARRILDAAHEWPSRPLFRPGRAEATLQRAQKGIDALGKGTPFLIVYYGSDGSGGWQTLGRPLRTVTTLDRFGLVTWVRGEPMLRMLQVPELRRAMGFGSDYALDAAGPRRERIRILGNGVAPPVMMAIVETLARRTVAAPQLPLTWWSEYQSQQLELVA